MMMKVFGKRGAGSRSGAGSAVLEAPEDTYASAPETFAGRGPAPAGALYKRNYAAPLDDATILSDALDGADAPYKPRLGSFRVRMRGGMPTSVAGRIAAGAVVLAPLAIAAGAVLATRSYLLHDERFVIPTSASIQTAGNTHLTRAQLLSVFGEDIERNTFKVPMQTRREDLERLPWVEHATVERLLPNRIRVEVTERTPVAFVRQGTHIGLVDAAGVLLDLPENTAGDPHYSFPVLTGLSQDDPLSTRAARMEIYRRFVRELDGSGQKISDSLSEVDVSNPEDVKALLPSGGTDILVHFGDENFLDRYRHFEAHLAEWKTQYPKLASADMRYENQVVLEMQAGTALPLATAGDAAGEPAKTPAVAKVPVVKAKPAAVAKAPVPRPVPDKKARIAAELAAARAGRTQAAGGAK